MAQPQTHSRRISLRGTVVVALLLTMVALAAVGILRPSLMPGAPSDKVGAPQTTNVPGVVADPGDPVVGRPERNGPPTTTIVPAEPSEPAVRLAVLGDVGTGDAAEWETAQLASVAGASDPFDALILLGDNVYPDGDPARLSATVFEPFDPILQQGTALLPVLGNHDVDNGHAAGQVETLGMPGRWYARQIGPMLIVALDSNLVDDPVQQQWLESTLRTSNAEWKLAAMHHPAYSAGYHGSTRSVQERWVPLFETYGVDLVLAGHDHDYQRSRPINGTTYIVSGAGAKTRPTDRADFTEYSASVLHWLDIEVWPDRIEVTAIGADGPIDRITLESCTDALSDASRESPRPSSEGCPSTTGP